MARFPLRPICGTMRVHRRLLASLPSYAATRAAGDNRALAAAHEAADLDRGVTIIPVVVHVVYHTRDQNISDEQVRSQIDVLNRDFRRANPDAATVPDPFAPLIADARLNFRLADTDPEGNTTAGVVRTATSRRSFTTDDRVKFSDTGGDDAWPSYSYLNIWVCELDVLGYAQFPGGPTETDGIVIFHSAFGTTGTAQAPFNLGRTTTHQVGHWLNLYHIWGDDGAGCSGTDFVPDTPNQAGENYGRPDFPQISCMNGPNGDLFMNYMDYVDDVARFMFTSGQVARMQTCLDEERKTIGRGGRDHTEQYR
jgi:hypothetical protein